MPCFCLHSLHLSRCGTWEDTAGARGPRLQSTAQVCHPDNEGIRRGADVQWWLGTLNADDEKRRVGLAGAKKGVLGTVAAMPFTLLGGGAASVSGAISPAASTSSETLADSWIDFLIEQAEAADDAQASLSHPPPSGMAILSDRCFLFTVLVPCKSRLESGIHF